MATSPGVTVYHFSKGHVVHFTVASKIRCHHAVKVVRRVGNVFPALGALTDDFTFYRQCVRCNRRWRIHEPE